jgi:hypothetical protein
LSHVGKLAALELARGVEGEVALEGIDGEQLDSVPGEMASEAPTSVGFSWDDYIGELVTQYGSLTAVAERLAEHRGYEDDVGSVERALRRLRSRGLQPGGKWGTRALSLFGLPGRVEQRLRWMAAYHSRFTDLPVALCEDLVRLWDHPPTTERRESRAWLALARCSIALRRGDHRAARSFLDPLRVQVERLPVEVRVEVWLVAAFIASREDPAQVPGLLTKVAPLLSRVKDKDERACFQARWIDQRAYELNKGPGGEPNHAAAEALYRELPSDGAPLFVLCRRASGLAYARWKQGHRDEAADLARIAVRFAGDAGHIRLRVMALNMLARIDPREREARARAIEMSRRLEDEALLLRLERGSGVSPRQS